MAGRLRFDLIHLRSCSAACYYAVAGCCVLTNPLPFQPSVHATLVRVSTGTLGIGFAGTNYCIHLLSSKPTMDAALLDQLLNASLSLGLNSQNLPFNMTLQDGCW